jgi:hypothetical protein
MNHMCQTLLRTYPWTAKQRSRILRTWYSIIAERITERRRAPVHIILRRELAVSRKVTYIIQSCEIVVPDQDV